MMECTAGTCGQKNNGLLVASPCDERLTQLWLIQQSSNQLENAGKQKLHARGSRALAEAAAYFCQHRHPFT